MIEEEGGIRGETSATRGISGEMGEHGRGTRDAGRCRGTVGYENMPLFADPWANAWPYEESQPLHHDTIRWWKSLSLPM